MVTVTRSDIADKVSSEIGLSKKDAGDIFDTVLDEMISSLSQGEDVKISSFGTFSLRDKKARVGRNPKTGVEAEITPRRVISFKPSQTMRKIINDN